jgi:hypothetical protein
MRLFIFRVPLARSLACSILLVFSGLASRATAEDFQGSTHMMEFDDAPVYYTQAIPADPVAMLRERIEKGGLRLPFDEKFGYLPGLLAEMHIPKSSQTLVFSKTSVQRKLISPKQPRALYFNDDVYIGYIPGAPIMEVSAVDPKIGAVFYQLEQQEMRRPKFVRNDNCLQCHASARSMGIPGHILRSVGTDADGEVDIQTEAQPIDHCTPMADRWAGWFVTGKHGTQTHRGNLIGAEAFTRHETEPEAMGNLTDLRQFFDTSAYIEPGSDIVALSVLQHQTHMHNYIARLNYETQIMMFRYGHIRYLKEQVNAFLRYLLFTQEAPLTEPISGNPEFVQEFSNRGPRDRQGRSLRDFDLQTRLFKYPCSYLIYSDAFDQLPKIMRDLLCARLYDILTGKDSNPDFAAIPEESRKAIFEILRETKPNLPAYWREAAIED